MSWKLRKWVRNYINPRIKDDWFITKINTFTATKSRSDVWEIYVEVACNDGEWTNAKMEFRDGHCINEDFIGDVWKKENVLDKKFELLLDYLKLIYISERKHGAYFEKRNK